MLKRGNNKRWKRKYDTERKLKPKTSVKWTYLGGFSKNIQRTIKKYEEISLANNPT